MDAVRLGTFTPSVLLDVARSTGALDAAGLDVTEIGVPSSPAQFQSLRAGEFDAVFTSPDNLIAYRFLPGNPLGELLDVQLVAGLDRGLGLCIGVRPGIDDPTQVRGGKLGVDVPNSGFAFVAYALLETLGLERGDYEIATLGSTPKRAAALSAGECDVTVLNAGNELVAQAGGCTLLSDVTTLGPYIGTVLARLESAPGAEAVDRLAVALLATSDGIRSGALQVEATDAAQRVLRLDATQATAHVAVLRDPARGLIAGGAVETVALHTLVSLRERFLPAPELADVPARFAELVRPGVLVP